MRRRLLVLAYYYPPLGGGGVHRVLGFTRHLPEHGWDCTVVCAGPEDYWVRDETLEIPNGTEVLRVTGGSALSAWLQLRRGGLAGRRSGRSFGWLRRASDWFLLPDSYAGWSRRAARVAARRIAAGGIDAMLSTSPPDSVHRAARALRQQVRLPWVADFRDPWIGLHFRRPPTAWHRDAQARMEREVLMDADHVLVASRTHADDLAAGNPPWQGRVTHLPNGFAPAPAAPPPDEDPATRPFRVVFTGTLSQMPAAMVFLDAVHDVLARWPEARRRLRVKFAGPYDTGVEDRAVSLGLRGIAEFLGPIPHDASRALQRSADLLLLWKPEGSGYRTMVPGKLYEYLESGRPQLALLSADDEAARLALAGGAVLADPGDPLGVTTALEGFYTRWREQGRQPDRRVPWLEEHTRAAGAARLAQLLDTVEAR